MFLKEKRCGTIKGRGCADGRPQRDYMTKDKTASPTVASTKCTVQYLCPRVYANGLLFFAAGFQFPTDDHFMMIDDIVSWREPKLVRLFLARQS
jgi:hypothetical protein